MMARTSKSLTTRNAQNVIPFSGQAALLNLLVALAALFFASQALAGLPMIADDEIPERLTAAEEDGIHVFTRVSLEEHPFVEFSGGGSDDLTPEASARLRGLVSGIQPNQWIFVQATADQMRWRGRKAKEAHRLNTSLAIARALWGLEYMERERITTLPPKLSQEKRGITVFIATYDEQVVPYPSAVPPPAPPPVVIREVEPAPSPLLVGMEVGVSVMRTAGLTITTPTVGVVIEKSSVRLDVGVGWVPAGENEIGELANGNFNMTASWFPKGGAFGPYLGWAAGSQFIRSVNEYMLLAHGPTVGGIARAHAWHLDGSLRVGYARVSVDEFEQDQRWANAFVFNVQVGKLF